ncbi:MAG: hypothetical protein CMB80_33320 [Flammeovirgaceae bacterium]|nr:hypothetical protein [Flammeovirgaceae bacterium]
MRTANENASSVVRRVDRRRLANNVQRVLLSLVKAGKDGWVPRTSLRVPSVGARIRDLRKSEFGGFEVECKTPSDLNKRGRSVKTSRQTFYRIVPRSVTVARLGRALKGVI